MILSSSYSLIVTLIPPFSPLIMLLTLAFYPFPTNITTTQLKIRRFNWPFVYSNLKDTVYLLKSDRTLFAICFNKEFIQVHFCLTSQLIT